MERQNFSTEKDSLIAERDVWKTSQHNTYSMGKTRVLAACYRIPSLEHKAGKVDIGVFTSRSHEMKKQHFLPTREEEEAAAKPGD